MSQIVGMQMKTTLIAAIYKKVQKLKRRFFPPKPIRSLLLIYEHRIFSIFNTVLHKFSSKTVIINEIRQGNFLDNMNKMLAVVAIIVVFGGSVE